MFVKLYSNTRAHPACVDLEDLQTALLIRQADLNLHLQAARPQHGLVQHVLPAQQHTRTQMVYRDTLQAQQDQPTQCVFLACMHVASVSGGGAGLTADLRMCLQGKVCRDTAAQGAIFSQRQLPVLPLHAPALCLLCLSCVRWPFFTSPPVSPATMATACCPWCSMAYLAATFDSHMCPRYISSQTCGHMHSKHVPAHLFVMLTINLGQQLLQVPYAAYMPDCGLRCSIHCRYLCSTP